MKVSELLKKLEKLKEKEGDIEVAVQTLSHLWAPDPVIRSGNRKYVLLNP